MKKKIVKKLAPKIIPKIDPSMPTNMVEGLLRALAGGKYILILDKGDSIQVDRCNVGNEVEFLGMLEQAKK